MKQSFEPLYPKKLTIGINRHGLFLMNQSDKKIIETFKLNQLGYWTKNEDNFAINIGGMVDGKKFVCETSHVIFFSFFFFFLFSICYF